MIGLRASSLHVRGVDHDQLASRQPFGSDEIQNLKRVVRGRLAVLIVGHQTTAEVRRKNLSRTKMLLGQNSTCPTPKGRQERQPRVLESSVSLASENTHLCRAAHVWSSGPIGKKRTE